MRVYLIRHGQTRWNLEGKIQGKTDVPLNEIGMEQAKLLAKAMEHKAVAAVYSSPLKRAYETARILAEEKSEPKPPIVRVDGLKEVDFGLWEGLTWEQINSAYPKDFAGWDQNPLSHTPTGGEPRERCRDRCKAAMDFILNQAGEGGDIAIVAHGGILVFVVDYLLRAQKDKNEIIVKNASITTLQYDRGTGKGTLLRLNDVRHLAGMAGGKTNKYC